MISNCRVVVPFFMCGENIHNHRYWDQVSRVSQFMATRCVCLSLKAGTPCVCLSLKAGTPCVCLSLKADIPCVCLSSKAGTACVYLSLKAGNACVCLSLKADILPWILLTLGHTIHDCLHSTGQHNYYSTLCP